MGCRIVWEYRPDFGLGYKRILRAIDGCIVSGILMACIVDLLDLEFP